MTIEEKRQIEEAERKRIAMALRERAFKCKPREAAWSFFLADQIETRKL